jgi:hypothetical protein
MSCFSFSLDLAIRGGYWHPQIFMDGIIPHNHDHSSLIAHHELLLMLTQMLVI